MLVVQNVYKTYPKSNKNQADVRALIDINFQIKKGEFISVLGHSGSGKTTLMNLIGGLDKPDSGIISYNNKNISNLSRAELATFRNKNVGFVFQSNYLEPQFTVLKNVCIPLIIAGVDKPTREKMAKNLLEELELTQERDRLVSKLSGGQMRRVCIARALINNPDIILADEPIDSLDQELADLVLRMLREITHKGVTVLMVTHNTEAAKKTDRILHLKKGCLE